MDARQRQFQSLVEAFAPDLYRFAAWLGWRRDQAEDLVQETFLRAWKGLDGLHDPQAAKPWLFTILRREHARRFERAALPCVSLDELDLERMCGVDDGRLHTDAILLRRALAGLSLDYREPLVLQVLGGYSCEEIAVLLDSTPGAIMTRLTRARQKLRHVLAGESETARNSEAEG